jgi:hypothetical protein
VEAIEGLAQSTAILVRCLCRGLVLTRYGLSGARKLPWIDVSIEGANLDAQALLIGNAGLETIEIERYDVGASGQEYQRERTEQCDALLEEFQIACGFCIHGSGQFIKLMLVVFLDIYRGRRTFVRRGPNLDRLARTRIVRVFAVACRKRGNPGGR